MHGSILTWSMLLVVAIAIIGGGMKLLPGILNRGLSPAVSASTQVAALDHFFTTEQFSGAVLVARAEKILLSKGYGMADWQHNIANRSQTIFRIGSVTQQFTAMAILLLQGQGKLHVQDPICTYIDACPAAWRPITIHQLLTHTSGIPDYTSFSDYNATKGQPTSTAQLLARFKGKPLDFSPGSMFSYSNSEYAVLGAIIEKVSGEAYATFLQQAIFGPLHMNQTSYDQSYPSLPDHATGYDRPRVPTDYIDMSVPFAAGALASTVDDLYRWDQAIFNGTFASRALLQEMFTPQALICPTPHSGSCGQYSEEHYGYGWFLDKEANSGRNVIFHPGSSDGFSALNEYFPDQKITVILLSNSGSGVGPSLMSSVETLFFA